MSFPGPVDTAAPVVGAASFAKTGAAQAPAGDFAAMVQDAQDGQNASVASDAQAANEESAEPRASDGSARAAGVALGATEADVVDVFQATDVANRALPTTNLAGFFRSLRHHSSAGSTPAPVDKSLGTAADASTPEAEAAAEDPQAVPAIVVVSEVTVTRHALPGLGVADAQDVQAAEDMPGAQNALDSKNVPGAQDVQSRQELRGVQGAQALAAARLMPVAQAAPAAPTAPSLPTAQGVPDPHAIDDVAALAAAPASPARDLPALAAPASQIELALPMAVAAEAATPRVDTLRGQGAQVAAQLREFVETLSAALPNAEDAPAAPAPALVFARPRAASLTVDAADTVAAAPKLRMAIAMAMGEAASPGADRVTVLPRLVPPVFSAPHSGTPMIAAAPATAQITATGWADAHVADQIVQSMRMQWMQGGGEATIELNPNALGKVQVQVRVDRGVVSASVEADTPIVREWLASHRDDLTQNLAQQGLRLDKLIIAETARESPSRDARDSRQAPREPARQRRDERGRETDTFELNDPQETT